MDDCKSCKYHYTVDGLDCGLLPFQDDEYIPSCLLSSIDDVIVSDDHVVFL